MMAVEHEKIFTPPHDDDGDIVAFSYDLHEDKRKLVILQKILSGEKSVNGNVQKIDTKPNTVDDFKTALHTVNFGRNIL